jgi:anti-sigma B factor antagonist
VKTDRLCWITVTSASTIDLERDGDVTVVVMRGEHDLSTADALREQLDAVRNEGRPFVVDLTETTFIDSAVLSVLIAEHDRAAAAGTAVGFAVGSGAGHTVRRIVDLTGLPAVLPIADSRAAAMQAIRGSD